MKKEVFVTTLAVAIAAQVSSPMVAAQMLEEVVVTAQKRSESLQDVPISVSVLGGDKMDDAGIDKMEDLVGFVPNIHMTETGTSTQLRIRGIGTGNNQGFEQSVGQYVDGIYYGRQQLIRAPFMDLERVEVLRGPQPTLFGKNSIAGAVSYTTAKPTDEFVGELATSFEFEAADALETSVILSGPLTQQLSARLAVRYYEEDGYIDNLGTGNSSPEREENTVRGTLLWDDGENLEVILKLEHGTFDSDGRATETVLDVGSGFSNILAGTGGKAFESNLDYKNATNDVEFSENELDNYTLTVNYELSNMTLTAISGFVSYEFSENFDGDFTDTNILEFPMAEDYDQFSQELRFTSPGGERLNWITGLFYQTSDLNFHDEATFPAGGYLEGLGSPLGNKIIARDYASDSDLWAVFAIADFSLTDFLRVSVGARYTEEKKDGSRVVQLLVHDPRGPASSDDADILAALNVETEQGTGHHLKGDRKEEAFTPQVNVQWDVTDESMLYASWSQGFKAGGFDARANTTASFEFDEEEASAFEIGAKNTFLDGSLSLNVAYYFTDYDDLQVSQFDGGLGFTVGNAKSTEVQGVEIDGRWAATENLTIAYAAAYNDFEYKDFSTGNCYQGQTPDGSMPGLCDYTGKTSPYAPELTANLSFDHTISLTDYLQLRSTLDFAYVDEHFISPNLDPRVIQEAYTTVNVRVAVESETWDLALIGKNLTDEEIRTYANNVPLSGSTFGQETYYAFIKRPMTVAVQGRYHF
jgi:iron complex outermembrane recepter protein